MSETLTLRDPAGILLNWQGRLIRVIRPESRAAFESVKKSATLQTFMEQGRVVGFSSLDEATRRRVLEQLSFSDKSVAVEQPRVWFPSFPYEWPAEMLHAAADLTLELAEKLAEEGMGIKDATPFNVLYEGPEPVFVDLLSFENRDPLESGWQAFGQFLRCFLYPLLAHRHLHMPQSAFFLTRRDGMEAAEIYPNLKWRQRLAPGVFSTLTLPALLNQWSGERSLDDTAMYLPKRRSNPELARFVFKGTLRYLRRHLNKLRPAQKTSSWSGYMEGFYSYTPPELAAKISVVKQFLGQQAPGRVLDIGCNTGHFSFLASEMGSQVVALDSDPAVVAQVWRTARERKSSVLPLVVNIARPTPAVGWMNCENASFLQRANGAFDGVMLLAVMHHLLVSEGIPLSEILRMAKMLAKRWVIFEFIDPRDRAFKNLCRGRDFSHVTRDEFERLAQTHFAIDACVRLEGADRWIYRLRTL